MKYDHVTLFHKNKTFLDEREKLKKAVLFYNEYATYFFALCYLLLCGYAAFVGKYAKQELVLILCIPLFALMLVTMLRPAAARPRPYEEEGAAITPLLEKRSRGNSFPSRHLTCAAVIATTALCYLPSLGIPLLLCALALGYARFAVGWHYPSDLLVGFLLGAIIGCIPLFL